MGVIVGAPRCKHHHAKRERHLQAAGLTDVSPMHVAIDTTTRMTAADEAAISERDMDGGFCHLTRVGASGGGRRGGG